MRYWCIGVLEALHTGLMLLQLKLTLTKEEQLAKNPELTYQCAAGFCKNCHSVTGCTTCSHLLAGPLTLSLTITGKCPCWLSLAAISRLEVCWQLSSLGLFPKLLEQQRFLKVGLICVPALRRRLYYRSSFFKAPKCDVMMTGFFKKACWWF